MSKETKYAKDSVVGIIGKVSQLVGGYGSLWLLTSILSDAAYGGYVAALAVIALVALLAQAGLKQATIQRVGELATDKEQQILTYVGAAVAWVGIASIAITGVTWLLTPLFPTVVDQNVVQWVQLLTLLIPGMALLPICGGMLRGLEQVSTAILLEQIMVQLLRLSGLTIAWVAWRDPVAVVLALGIAYYIPIAAFGIRTRGWQYLNLTGMSITHLRYSGYLLINSIASKFLKNIDVLLLASLATLPATGGYNIAWKLALVARYGDSILTNTIQPRLSKYLASNQIGELREEFDQVRDLSVVATIPVLIVVLLFGESLLGVFGNYVDQYAVLVVLTIGATVNASFGSIGQILIMGKRGRLVLLNTLISLGGNIALNIVLIPRFGAMGAAIATVFIVYFLTNLLGTLQVYYLMDINTVDLVPLTVTGALAAAVGLVTLNLIAIEIALGIALLATGLLLYRRVNFVKGLLSVVWNRVSRVVLYNDTYK